MGEGVGQPPVPTGRTLRRFVGDEVWADLVGRTFERCHPASCVLLRQGESGTHVLVVLSGVAKVVRQERNGDVTLLAFRGAGELLGEMAVLDHCERSATVQSISPCRVGVLSRPDFLRFIADRDLFPVLVRYALSRVRESDEARGGGGVARRLAATLVQLADISEPGLPKVAETAAGPAGRSGRVRSSELALTRNELAQYLGASRNTVSRALKELERHHVHAGRRSIVLADLAALRRAVAAAQEK